MKHLQGRHHDSKECVLCRAPLGWVAFPIKLGLDELKVPVT